MKRLGAILILATATLVYCAGPALAGVGFRVTGGMSYIGYGNYNDWVDFMNDAAIPKVEELTGQSIGDTFDKMRWVPEFKGELLVSVMPGFDVGAGAGLIMGSSNFEFAFEGISQEYSYEHKVRAYPFTATAYLEPPLPFGFAKPFVYGGLGLYYAKLTFDEYMLDVLMEEGVEAELTKWGFGLHGGAGLQISVAPAISLDLGINVRWANIKGFTGTATYMDGSTEEIVLGYYEGGEEYIGYGWVAEGELGDAEEGEVNLSGFGFVIGFKFMF
jgi:opacity protein-like surface antigen